MRSTQLFAMLFALVLAPSLFAQEPPPPAPYLRAGWVPGVGHGVAYHNPYTGQSGAHAAGWWGAAGTHSGPVVQGSYRVGWAGYAYQATGPNGNTVTRARTWWGPGTLSVTGPATGTPTYQGY